ncbi:MAG: CCA tRNA nucleotidyltransferase [Candidatus Caldarchaeum sp.]|uniref:CCA-adding enzyme n=1 Tax=Caldiarchaeum subterraneum TaxID=311458 RepID=A0A7J3VTT9_CALS0
MRQIFEQVLEEIRPLPETLRVAAELAERLVGLVEEFFGPGTASVEGSFAKGTMVRGREEVDVFVHFKPGVPVEKASQMVLARGVEIVRSLGGVVRLRYASHPYVEGFVRGLRVNIVPCYDVEYGRWITPVDRTPHHTRYVKKTMDEGMADETRLLKAFLMNDGLYGAEIRVRGFSGYVCELLIIKHGSFSALLERVAGWRPPVVLDGDASEYQEAVMILPDPVDRSRNAAAAVSLTSLSKFILKSKLFLRKPAKSFFTGRPRAEISLEDRRFMGMVFDVPEKPPDVLWGELQKTMNGLGRALTTHGYRPLRMECWLDGFKAVILYELDTLTLPAVYLHVGPPVWSRSAVEFVEEQARKEDVAACPWVSGDRLYSLRRRKYTNAVDFVRHLVDQDLAAVSKELKPYLKKMTTTTDPQQILSTLSQEGKAFFEEFIRACPSFIALYNSSH